MSRFALTAALVSLFGTIYGVDGRKDLYEVTDSRQAALARSTVALFRERSVEVGRAGDEQLPGRLKVAPLGKLHGLCPGEKFYEQPAGAFCSGTLVAPDLVLTAGHCVTGRETKQLPFDPLATAVFEVVQRLYEAAARGATREELIELQNQILREQAAEKKRTPCETMRLVFGYGITEKGMMPAEVLPRDVYSCREIVKVVDDVGDADWALVRLDRPVEDAEALGRVPVRIRRDGKRIEKGTGLFVIGHPSGLPTKVGDGVVRDSSKDTHFVTNLDTYGGNSGSGVFNAETGELEGVLVRGEGDYVFDNGKGCYKSIQCTDTGCRGEDVTAVGQFSGFIPRLRD